MESIQDRHLDENRNPPGTAIPAKAGIHPAPSFRRKPRSTQRHHSSESRNPPSTVIPANAGIHFDFALSRAGSSRAEARSKWIPAFAGMTAGERRGALRDERPTAVQSPFDRRLIAAPPRPNLAHPISRRLTGFKRAQRCPSPKCGHVRARCESFPRRPDSFPLSPCPQRRTPSRNDGGRRLRGAVRRGAPEPRRAAPFPSRPPPRRIR